MIPFVAFVGVWGWVPDATFEKGAFEMTNGSANGPVLSGRGLKQSFGERTVLSGVDIDLQHGEVLGVVGVSGSGKSTLLYALAGLRQPEEGTVVWGDTDVWSLQEPHITRARRSTCGFVFQFSAFLDDLTVAANVAVPLVVSGTRPRDARKRAIELMERFGLGELGDEYPSTLSGGEQQRASIARALTMDPRIVFCDEPTGALDEKNSELVVGELRGIAESFGVGVLIVTHDPLVSESCDRVVRLEQGSLVEEDGS